MRADFAGIEAKQKVRSQKEKDESIRSRTLKRMASFRHTLAENTILKL